MSDFENTQWHLEEPEAVCQKLKTSKNGLDFNEAKKRLKEYGLNTLQMKTSETIPRIFLRQLKNPLVYVLLFSTFLAFALGKITDGFVVFSVVILNTLIGFFQEYQANRIIRALSEMVPHNTTVMRDGVLKLIRSLQVVPGDVIVLQAGDKISADLRLFSIKNLQCDESSLTGESLPVFKKIEAISSDVPIAERKCMAFSGTYVTTGTGMGIVVSTGFKTEFGKISELIEQVIPLETPLSLTIKKIARGISVGVITIGASLFIIGYLRGSTLFDSGLTAIALAVAAIPEGLPAIITIASSIGVQRMARKQAIVRQLPAVEALGSTTVICTDKTGTLTHNEMTVQRLWTHSGFSFVTGSGFTSEGHIIPPEDKQLKDKIVEEEIIPLLTGAILCNDAILDQTPSGWVPVGDPTEIALVIAGRKIHLDEDQLRSEWKRDDVIPFEAEQRMMATLNTSLLNKQYVFIKGAPEEILRTCSMDKSMHSNILTFVDEMAEEGMRVLAVAKKEIQNPLTALQETEVKQGFILLGLIGMIDPPRTEVYKALKACYAAGINVKMVTGDHPKTAKAIGLDLGLMKKDEKVISGIDLDQLSQDEWKKIVPAYNVFARTSPEHKLKLVQTLQEDNHVVAMTGDGVNDAPALKRADIGVAMGIKGTAVAKEASDMILADDNFASIEVAVEEGRRVYDNLIKSLVFILPTSLGQALVILIAVLFFPIHQGVLLHPMSPVQILWVNLVVAVALALPLAFEAKEQDIMSRPPRKKQEPIVSNFILVRTLTVSVLMAVGTIGLFLWEYHFEISKRTIEKIAIAEAQTMAVTAMMLFQVFYLFHCRSLKSSVLKTSFFSNPFILIGVGVVLLAQIAFTYLPFMNRLFHSSSLNLEAWLISTGVAFLIFLVIASEKAITKKFSK